ncbi:hypothetical protein M2138_000108 [Dysgonomonadaceae bacterium PH5-43]|nr:hypothetical protein [Dysgonomonadaceae bacterium PH5-43]
MLRLGERKAKEISALVYTFFWGVIIFGATFPNALLSGDFSFLTSNDVVELSKSYLFSLTMVIVLHLIDTAYLVLTTKDFEKEQMRLSLIMNFIFLALIAVFLIFTVAVELLFAKIICFFLFWIALLVIKYLSIKFAQPKIIELNKPVIISEI